MLYVDSFIKQNGRNIFYSNNSEELASYRYKQYLKVDESFYDEDHVSHKQIISMISWHKTCKIYNGVCLF